MKHVDVDVLRSDERGADVLRREPLVARDALCIVCQKPLGLYERKLHRGACALARKTQLQRLRRQRTRL